MFTKKFKQKMKNVAKIGITGLCGCALMACACIDYDHSNLAKILPVVIPTAILSLAWVVGFLYVNGLILFTNPYYDKMEKQMKKGG